MASLLVQKKDGNSFTLDNLISIKGITSAGRQVDYPPEQWDNIPLTDYRLAFIGQKQNAYISSSEISHIIITKN